MSLSVHSMIVVIFVKIKININLIIKALHFELNRPLSLHLLEEIIAQIYI